MVRSHEFRAVCTGMKRKKLPSFSSLERKLDTVFSRYIRKRDANAHGWVHCCTCGKAFEVSQVHAGHYVKRSHRSLRWHPQNVHAQCASCNVFRGGVQDEYARPQNYLRKFLAGPPYPRPMRSAK
jgi:hypothetical protein